MGQRSCHKKIGLPLCRGRDNRRKDEVIEYGVTFNTTTLQKHNYIFPINAKECRLQRGVRANWGTSSEVSLRWQDIL